MLESIKDLSGWCHKQKKWSTNFGDEDLWNKMNQMVTWNLQRQLDLGANQ
jgi:hypothetical protein